MPEQPLVSIIIPTFNRAHLIGETLDSVLAQTYTNWECIVVDDGSTDGTAALLGNYIAKDSRLQYHHRPANRPRGGNAARNYGFDMSQGQYIQWFDSDDLMASTKLEVKMNTILKYNVDFVISETKYFNKDDTTPHAYNFDESEVNFLSYATTHINWFTPDLLVKRNVVKDIRFNEELKSGQEFNFFCKLLLITNDLKKINQVLTHRRFTENSIGTERRINENRYLLTRFQSYWLNYLEISKITKNEYFERFSLLTCISCYFRCKKTMPLPNKFNKRVIKVFGKQSFYFFLAKWSKRFTGRYNFFYKKLKN